MNTVHATPAELAQVKLWLRNAQNNSLGLKLSRQEVALIIRIIRDLEAHIEELEKMHHG